MDQNIELEWEAKPLPPEKAERFAFVPTLFSAYNVCLRFECDAAKNIEAKGKTTKSVTEELEARLVHARILGYMLIHIHAHRALAELARQIHSCNNADDQFKKLNELGSWFRYFFIMHFRKNKGNLKTSMSSDHPSRPSFDRDRLSRMGNLKEAPRNHKEAKERALKRDGYRCQITGVYDVLARELDIATRRERLVAGEVHTECAHILPESTYFNVTGPGNEVKASYAASVLTVLERFGHSTEELNGAKVHSLSNIMTLEKNTHDMFDRLELWLEKTDIPNQYRPTTVFEGFSQLLLPKVVTFTSPDPKVFPLPSPDLLSLHAACAKVAHLSGAAEYINKFDRDLDFLDVLAPDGTSSGLLDHLIWEKLGTSVDVGA